MMRDAEVYSTQAFHASGPLINSPHVRLRSSAWMGEPASTSCALWLPKKRRYCNFAPVTGFSYCGHHLASRGDTQGAKGQERIPCPLDGRHSIFAKDLQRHLKVCPRAKEIALQESQPYFQRDANRGDELEPAPASSSTAMANGAGGAEATAPATAADAPIHFSLEARRASALDSISTDALMALLQRVEKAHRESAERVRPEPEVEMGAGAGDGAGAKRQKHALQNDRMVSVMAALGLLSPGATHIEFGAGKGALSAAVSEASLVPPRHVLVDLIKPHGSADRELEQRGATCVRLKVDICHLLLRGVPQLWPPQPAADAAGAAGVAGEAAGVAGEAAGVAGEAVSEVACVPCAPQASGKWSAVGKHLCGVATDYTLRSLVAAASGGSDGARRAVVDGVVVATCCHHRCEWRSYVNQEYILSLGFSREQFGTLCALSSWATGCRPSAGATTAAAAEGSAVLQSGAAAGLPPPTVAAEAEEHQPADTAATRALERSIGGRLSAAERVQLGLACKRLLDTGRLRYLARHGYRGWLQHYVPESVSPENTLLVAVPRGE